MFTSKTQFEVLGIILCGCIFVHVSLLSLLNEVSMFCELIGLVCRVVKMLIEICRDAITIKDEDGNMALHLACRKGHLKVVQEIVCLEAKTIAGTKYL